MSLSSSPSLKEYKNGIPTKHRDPDARKKNFRIVVIFLLVIALMLLFFQFFQSDVAALAIGRGTLSGRIVDENGQALSAQVFVFGVDRLVDTGIDGSFIYKNVPAGERSLIITYNGTAQEFVVQAQAGTTVDLGDLSFLVTTPTVQP